MKTSRILLIIAMMASGLGFNSCSPEDDIKNPELKPLLLNEDFAKGFVDNTTLAVPGWINFNEIGVSKYKWQEYQHNAYAEFTSYQSGNAVNIGWLISPAVTLTGEQKLSFQASQSYVTSASNSLEVLISTDFDGTNVTAATWNALPATLPTTASTYFLFINSGTINLSAYTGKAYIAFKVKGSGTNTALDGGYQIDNVKIFK